MLIDTHRFMDYQVFQISLYAPVVAAWGLARQAVP
jgi:hypothetical protein